ncbi:MAG: hypothetical protein RJA35_47, partial [Actinomycetota bacterium]
AHVDAVRRGLPCIFRAKKTDRSLNLAIRANVSLTALAAYIRFALGMPVAELHEAAVGLCLTRGLRPEACD